MHLDYYWFKKLFKGEKFDIKAERVFFALSHVKFSD